MKSHLSIQIQYLPLLLYPRPTRAISRTHPTGPPASGNRLSLSVLPLLAAGGRLLLPEPPANGQTLGQEVAVPRNFNRISGPDANACAGCHNAPFGPGRGGDMRASVFGLGLRFHFAMPGPNTTRPTQSSVDEGDMLVTLQSIGNSRATVGMLGAGCIELLAHEMTADLRAIRDAMPPESEAVLETKGVQFARLSRAADGSWDCSG